MILYFSGTGNSRYVAEQLALRLEDKAISIIEFIKGSQVLTENADATSIGFVFPVYSWGISPLLLDIIENKISDKVYFRENGHQKYVWSVLTYGDETGLAYEMLQSSFAKRRVANLPIWGITMPNNYVLLPGFDVDSPDVERKKLTEAPKRIEAIATDLRCRVAKIDVVAGSNAWLKTKFVYPLFKRWGIFPKKWHYLSSCVGCGKCEKACQLNNIIMSNGHPVWGNNCCSCLACYHVCPYHAVAYGKATKKKGQYMLQKNLVTELS